VAGLILEESRPADFTRRCEESVRWSICAPPSWLIWFMPKGARDEAAALSRVTYQVENATPLQNKPVLVLSRATKRTGKHSFETVWAEAQSGLAARYPASRHLTRGSGHYLHHGQWAWFVASVQDFLSDVTGSPALRSAE